jgi:hypothetical protein
MEQMLLNELYDAPINIKKGPITPFAQAMPDQYKDNNAIVAYRKYYLGEKIRFAKWKFTEEPEWWITKTAEVSSDVFLPF